MAIIRRWKHFRVWEVTEDERTSDELPADRDFTHTLHVAANGSFNAQTSWWELTASFIEESEFAPKPLGYVYVLKEYGWYFRGQVYVSDDAELTVADVHALVNEQANRRRLQLEKAHALQAMAEDLKRGGTRRQRIPQDVKVAVWQRDGGRCVECDGNTDLEFDHVIPLAMGGSSNVRNLQLLCGPCNRRKGATLG